MSIGTIIRYDTPPINIMTHIINTPTRLDDKSGCVKIASTGIAETTQTFTNVDTLSSFECSFENNAASVIISIIFISSVGWNVIGPSSIHLYVPVLLSVPKGVCTASVSKIPAI